MGRLGRFHTLEWVTPCRGMDELKMRMSEDAEQVPTINGIAVTDLLAYGRAGCRAKGA